MGNHLSNFEHGSIVIVLDQPYFKSGTEMTGNIYIQLSQPYPATSLTLTLAGKEKSYFYQDKNNHPHQDSHHTFIKNSMIEYMGKLFQKIC